MIAVTAVVSPAESLQVLHLLGQCFRRHFESVPVANDQLLVKIPLVGEVLVTEESTRIRLEMVTESESTVDLITDALEREVHRLVNHQRLVIAWGRSAFVPSPLR
jgi:hypothetical protein